MAGLLVPFVANMLNCDRMHEGWTLLYSWCNCVCRDAEVVSVVSSDENVASVITMAETVVNKVL